MPPLPMPAYALVRDPTIIVSCVSPGLGDQWGSRPVPSSAQERELGAHILQVRVSPRFSLYACSLTHYALFITMDRCDMGNMFRLFIVHERYIEIDVEIEMFCEFQLKKRVN